MSLIIIKQKYSVFKVKNVIFNILQIAFSGESGVFCPISYPC